MGRAFIVKMFSIVADIFVVGLPRIEVPQQQVMLSARGLAQRNQIAWIKLQLGMQVERLDMMNLQMLALVTTGYTRGLAQAMLPFYSGPFGAACMPQALSD